jgi:hypothetical protein
MTNEVTTTVKVQANCQYVEIEFNEKSKEGFGLELKLLPDDAINVAYRLLAAAKELKEVNCGSTAL